MSSKNQMKPTEPLGIDGDGNEVAPLGEGWLLIGGGDYLEMTAELEGFDAVFEVRDWLNLLENAEDGQTVWSQAVSEIPYFEALAGEFPPFFNPRGY